MNSIKTQMAELCDKQVELAKCARDEIQSELARTDLRVSGAKLEMVEPLNCLGLVTLTVRVDLDELLTWLGEIKDGQGNLERKDD